MPGLWSRVRHTRSADWLRLLDRLLCHAAIVLSGMLAVFFLIDRVNKHMSFMTNEFHKRITFALALMAVYLAVRRIAAARRSERDDYRRKLRSYEKTTSEE